jgi:bis(5'-nucleosidyl)-tetraphosphatase
MSDLQAAGAICYFKEGRKTLFLLLRSAKTSEWGPPKGHAEQDETEVETAVREIYEETGIRRASFTPGFREVLHYEVEKKGKLRKKDVVLLLCKLDSDDVRLSSEHTEFHFATLDEVEVLVPHEDLREVFRKAQSFLKS